MDGCGRGLDRARASGTGPEPPPPDLSWAGGSLCEGCSSFVRSKLVCQSLIERSCPAFGYWICPRRRTVGGCRLLREGGQDASCLGCCADDVGGRFADRLEVPQRTDYERAEAR